MEKLKKLLGILEERLVQHDNNREEVQKQLKEICAMAKEEADSSEARESKEIREAYEETEERILSLVGMLNAKLEGPVNNKDLDALIEWAEQELKIEQKCSIVSKEGRYHSVPYEPSRKKQKLNETEETDEKNGSTTELITGIVKQLEEHLERAQETMISVMSNVEKVYNEERSEADEFVETVNKKLEVLFTKEDARIQAVVKVMRESIWSEAPENGRIAKELIMKAKEDFLTVQKYILLELSSPKGTLRDRYDLVVEKEVSLECIGLEEMMPVITSTSPTGKGGMYAFFTLFDEGDADMVRLLKSLNFTFEVTVKIWEKGTTEDSAITKILIGTWSLRNKNMIWATGTVSSGKTHLLKMRVESKEECTQWSNTVEFIPDFSEYCGWKECPENVDKQRKYSVDEKNPRIATKKDNSWCTIIGNTPLPHNKVTSWKIKILKSGEKHGVDMYVGVAPSDINQNEDRNFEKCGWYFDCYYSTLRSGPPQNYKWKRYGPRKEEGQYVHTGDIIGVVMDTAKGELSFVLNGVNLGVAYEGIPLDKPLVPCVILREQGDSVELDTSGVKDTVVDSSIPTPSKITEKSTTWDSITLAWDVVEGTSFYQIEVDGSKVWDSSTANRFTKKEFFPDTEHIFKVRAVKGNSVSEWSDVVKGRTQKASDFSECVWKECPDYVYRDRKYSVYEMNLRIATKIGGGWNTNIGSTHLPLNKVTSWNIKILKSRYNNGDGIFIGVSPFDIDQNKYNNERGCGWYFDCYHSSLYSGPPHNYNYKEYGPRKGYREKYVHTGDSVGVVMDTAKGELSFVLNKVSLGVAYEGIPLDKPLVPCVLLYNEGDSVEFVI